MFRLFKEFRCWHHKIHLQWRKGNFKKRCGKCDLSQPFHSLAMKGGHCWLVVFMQEVAILWFTPQYCDVVQYGASSNNKADLLRLHSYFWVKQMKPSLPPSKGLFNGHPCSFMGLVECFLIYRCRVEIWGHEICFTRVPTIFKKQAIFQCAGLRLKPLTNQWTAKYEAVMCATRPSCNDVRKHA